MTKPSDSIQREDDNGKNVARNEISNESDLDYYSTKPYKIISGNVGEHVRAILGDCGHAGRYGINLARQNPGKSVFLCDLTQATGSLKIENAMNAKHNSKYISNIFIAIGETSAQQNVSLPYKDSSFDYVFTFELENHVDYKAVFAELFRALAPGGKILVGVPNYYNYFHTLRKRMIAGCETESEYGYEKSFKHSELKALFNEFGLREIKIHGICPMHALMRLSRVSKYKRALNLVKWWSLNKVIDMTIFRLIDILTIGKLSYRFGFEIIAEGIKARE